MVIENIEQEIEHRCDCCGGSFYEEDLYFDDSNCTTICSACDKFCDEDEEDEI